MSTKLFVGGLPFKYSDSELRALLSPAGQIVSATMVPDPPRGRTRGFGFVEMATPEEAQAAIAQFNGTKVAEKSIFVTQARERPVGSAPRSFKAPFQRKAYKDSRLPRPPRRFSPPSSGPSGEFRSEGRNTDRPARGYQGKRPFDRNRSPGSFGAPRTGFQRPENSPSGRPSGENRRSFSPPRDQKGDFGPSNRRGPKGPGQSGTPDTRPPKKSFWNKFDKKKPHQEF